MVNSRIFEIAGGNSTVFVYGNPRNKKSIVKKFLKEVEQVGFVSGDRMSMMGGEMCINATLAFASTLDKGGELFTSGIDKPVKYINSKDVTKVNLPLSYRILDNVVLFDGIGFVCIDKKSKARVTKKFLVGLADEYGLPAFGAIVYEGNEIVPYVYVKGVDSFVKETACGSGSVAYALFSGFSEIVQPTRESLSIKIKKDKVVVSGEVKEIKNGE